MGGSGVLLDRDVLEDSSPNETQRFLNFSHVSRSKKIDSFHLLVEARTEEPADHSLNQKAKPKEAQCKQMFGRKLEFFAHHPSIHPSILLS